MEVIILRHGALEHDRLSYSPGRAEGGVLLGQTAALTTTLNKTEFHWDIHLFSPDSLSPVQPNCL